MKAKTIQKIIKGTVDKWIESIEDEGLKAAAQRDTIVTGGCIVSMLLNEPVNDFDIYFRTRETALRMAQYYVARFKNERTHPVPIIIEVREDEKINAVKIYVKSAGVVGEESEGYTYFEQGGSDPQAYIDGLKKGDGEEEDGTRGKFRPVHLSENAITLTNRIQIVVRFSGNPEEIHENYDFVHCTNFWENKTNGLHLNAAALQAILEKDLKYVGSLYPLASVIRTRKFIQRGWSITAGEYLKMLLQLNEMDLSKIEVLQEQLTGVDAAYFVELLDVLREKYDSGQSIDSTYLATLIDKML